MQNTGIFLALACALTAHGISARGVKLDDPTQEINRLKGENAELLRKLEAKEQQLTGRSYSTSAAPTSFSSSSFQSQSFPSAAPMRPVSIPSAPQATSTPLPVQAVPISVSLPQIPTVPTTPVSTTPTPTALQTTQRRVEAGKHWVN